MKQDLSDTQIQQLLSDHHAPTQMDGAFRAFLLQKTVRQVAARQRLWQKRLAFSFGAAVLVLIAVVSFTLFQPHGQTLPTVPSGLYDTKAALPASVHASAGELVFTRIRGNVTLADGSAVRQGQRLGLGNVVITGPDSRATLLTRSGSEITLGPDSRFSLTADRIARFADGRIYCRNRNEDFKEINTTAGRIELLGTTINAAFQDDESVNVTVLEGRVRLENSQGDALVDAGKQSTLVASLPPTSGAEVNTLAETAWYHGRDQILSGTNQIAYVVRRPEAEGRLYEIWLMDADGANKHRLSSYVGSRAGVNGWLPGDAWLYFRPGYLCWAPPNPDDPTPYTRGAGHPILRPPYWLINAATGQEMPFPVLETLKDHISSRIHFSPDAAMAAFHGRYPPDAADPRSATNAIWLLDLETGEMTPLAIEDKDSAFFNLVAWTPDSRCVTTSRATPENYGYNASHTLFTIDVKTGEITDLGMKGVFPSWSPDGTKLAFTGDLPENYPYRDGSIFSQGSLFTLDLTSDVEPVRATPAGICASSPRWSPDGTRLLFTKSEWELATIYVTSADGMATKKIFEVEGDDGRIPLGEPAWAPSGDAIYARVGDSMLLLDACGGGVIANLGGNAEDSFLTEEEEAQTQAVIEELKEAVFHYANGYILAEEGRKAEAKRAFRMAADIFAGLPYDYPLADLSVEEIMMYVDKCEEMAKGL